MKHNVNTRASHNTLIVTEYRADIMTLHDERRKKEDGDSYFRSDTNYTTTRLAKVTDLRTLKKTPRVTKESHLRPSQIHQISGTNTEGNLHIWRYIMAQSPNTLKIRSNISGATVIGPRALWSKDCLIGTRSRRMSIRRIKTNPF